MSQLAPLSSLPLVSHCIPGNLPPPLLELKVHCPGTVAYLTLMHSLQWGLVRLRVTVFIENFYVPVTVLSEPDS